MMPKRTGFTILETIVALAMLGIALVLMSQLTVQSLVERQRGNERLTAIERCNDVLETARALPWSKLTPQWAGEQKLSSELADALLEPQFQVRVDNLEPRIRRVTVELRWQHRHGVAARPVKLTALFADRSGGNGS